MTEFGCSFWIGRAVGERDGDLSRQADRGGLLPDRQHGRIFERDFDSLLAAITAELLEMNLAIADRRRTRQADASQAVEFEDYDSTSGNYNDTRIPVGLPIILGYLASMPIGLSEQTILDAGCGTGNYLAALHGRVGKLHGVELNTGMQQVARERFADDPSIQIDQGSITELAFADGTFDGIICNQVLHHLDRGEGEDANTAEFPNVTAFIHEAFRVLRPGGVVVINISSHQQVRDGFWWAALIPAAVDRMVRRCPSLDRYESFFREAGFEGFDVVIPVVEVLQGQGYLDPVGPLSAAWRAGDSTWSLTTEEELPQALDNVTARLEEGSMGAFMEGREQLRARIGQTTFLAARKPGRSSAP